MTVIYHKAKRIGQFLNETLMMTTKVTKNCPTNTTSKKNRYFWSNLYKIINKQITWSIWTDTKIKIKPQ